MTLTVLMITSGAVMLWLDDKANARKARDLAASIFRAICCEFAPWFLIWQVSINL